ncbi:MAG: hypothetical protein ACTHJ5_15325 [Ilyomonas sp.]
MKKHPLPLLLTSLLLLFLMPVYLACKNSTTNKTNPSTSTDSLDEENASAMRIPNEEPVFYVRNKDLQNLVNGKIHKLIITTTISRSGFRLIFWKSKQEDMTYDAASDLKPTNFTVKLNGIRNGQLLLNNLEIERSDIKKVHDYIQNKPDSFLVFEPQLEPWDELGLKANTIVYNIYALDHVPTSKKDLDENKDRAQLAKLNPSPPRKSY